MSKSVSVWLDDNQVERLKEMRDAGAVESISEAARQHIPGTGEPIDTPFRQAVRRLGDAFGLLGVFLIGLTYFGPLRWRILAVAPFISAFVCYGVDRVLRRYEPRVSGAMNRFVRRFGRGGGA